jgi:twitching motility protein PilU
MKKSRELGMQTFDQALFDLIEAGKISYEDALRNADSLNELRLALKLQGSETAGSDHGAGFAGLKII